MSRPRPTSLKGLPALVVSAAALAAPLASALTAALLGVLAHTAALLGALTLRHSPPLDELMLQKRRLSLLSELVA